MPDIEPPTPDEIETYKAAMLSADKALKLPPRAYTDTEVAAALMETIPDSGGTALGELRALKSGLKFFRSLISEDESRDTILGHLFHRIPK